MSFYVYAYLRQRASEHGPAGSPYYIGKGSGDRAWTKFKGETLPPVDKTFVQILADNLTEKAAFQLEKELVKLHGRIDLGTGCLRNKTEGGDGGVGIKRSEEEKKRRSLDLLAKWQDPTFREKMLRAPRKPRRRGYKRKPHSEKTKQLIAVAHLGLPAWNKGQKTGPAWNKGKTMWDAAARKEMSKQRKGIAPKLKPDSVARRVQTRKQNGWWAKDR